ncbi:MAG: tRNA (cytidine32/uridine32-2'-O)-methyltransferase [Halobacteriales archaeon]|jgi:tRNA (cytidine32/uridine32-2'-O)-methyltransferase
MTVPAVAVVDAQTPGNVGTIARAMKNFGFSDLLLVDPPEDVHDPDGVAYGFAGHAREDILPNSEVVDFEHLVENYYTIGMTATTNEDSRRHVRYPFSTPAEIREDLASVKTDATLVFGREDVGLTNEELARLDAIGAIPASVEYPVLNLGQAATITLYELRDLAVKETQLPDGERERADETQIERLYDQWDLLLDAVNHPEEKRAKTMRMVRRIFGRAHLTEGEVITMLGILRRAQEFAGGEDKHDAQTR